MGSKKRGHYCIGCGDYLPNEKFSGKGHRKHLCKECKRKEITVSSESTSEYDRKLYLLSQGIRNCMLVYMQNEGFFLFEYQRSRYMISDDLNSKIYVYQENSEQKFIVSEALQKGEILMEVLYKKYEETMENGHVLDYEDGVEEEYLEISKKRRQFLGVIVAIQQVM
ncbi:hypothetical protein J2Y03_002297 [Neobacillus niacini]|uniref:hypothetical protein n=1 Tax=Neobacillus niacini TaxID=86668 RepID=UPI002857E22F|nr:hypothetical protein [Neobacillus niacini]MDR7077273.1 hypothetical protein [Neobacillus niacini]